MVLVTLVILTLLQSLRAVNQLQSKKSLVTTCLEALTLLVVLSLPRLSNLRLLGKRVTMPLAISELLAKCLILLNRRKLNQSLQATMDLAILAT